MINIPKESVEIVNIDASAVSFTLKILFGPLFGCELHLPADDYFIIINSGPSHNNSESLLINAQDNTATYAQKTLFIPCNIHSPNLLLHLTNTTKNEEHTGYQIEILDEKNAHSIWIKENKPFKYEHICFALKQEKDEWCNDLSCHSLTQPEPLLLPSVSHVNKIINNKKIILLCCFLFLLFIIGSVSLSWLYYYKDESHMNALQLSLAGSPGPLNVIKAKNNNIYILGNGFREIEWLREVLYKRDDSSTVFPVWTIQAKKNIIKKLYNEGYPVLQLDLTTPKHPKLLVYQELKNKQIKQINESILQQLPFAEDVAIDIENIDNILNLAQQGLERLQIPYRKINANNGYALVIRDAINDTTLNSLREFITNFHHQWGEYVINFSIILDDDWLKDKSYLEAQEGYLFLNPNHWYFPANRGAA